MGSELWTEVEPSQFAHEREALDFVRRRFPDREPWRAWSNFTFVDEQGRPSEVDLLVVAPRGVFLVEIKSFPDGVLDADAATWRWSKPNGQVRSYDNPFIAADGKAKRLKSLLLNQKALRGGSAPRNVHKLWVEAVVFLSSPTLTVKLDDRLRPHVLGPDPEDGQKQENRLDGLIAHLKELDPRRGASVDRPLSAAIAVALDQAGIRQSEKYRNAGSYQLVETLDEGDTWQDFRATHKMSKVDKRVRIHLRGRGADQTEADAIDRAAEREFRLLAALHHPSIERPETLEPNPRGLATIYPFDPEIVRLDHWVDTHADADLLTRLTLFRRIAEAVAYAHEHGLAHRSLSPRRVWVTDPDGDPQPRLRDWGTVARDLGTTATNATNLSQSRLPEGTRHAGHLIRLAGEDAGPYLAPELRTVPEASGRLADVFALGCLLHLMIAGTAPADDADGLQGLLDEHGHVPLAAAMDAPPAQLAEVVALATEADASDRFESVGDLLGWLDAALENLTAPEQADILEAGAGAVIDGWTVRSRLGAGATSIVLLAERDGTTEVLKVARDRDNAERLRAEHEVLERLRHPAIIASRGLVKFGDRTALRLVPGLTRRKGDAVVAETLAARLRSEGPPTVDLLQRWGTDLLDALVLLEREGVDHRDIKPENLVFVETGKYKETHLALIDFSLAKVPPTDIEAGTIGYLDPFLRDRPDRRWDLAAERYAAAVVLCELATGERPSWGEGVDPRASALDVPHIRRDAIDPAVQDRLTALLQRALHRDPTQRFDTADDLRRAWERAFVGVDEPTVQTPGASAAELDLSNVTATTTIAELGLTPRVAGAIERLGVPDVGSLARIQHGLSISGVGATVRKEVRHLVKRLRDAGFADDPEQIGELDEADEARLSVDRLAERLVPPSNLDEATRLMLRALIGLDDTVGQPWPTEIATAEATGIAPTNVAAQLDKAAHRWANYRPELVHVRDEIRDWLARNAGVATADELATMLLQRRGSVTDEPLRGRRARAVIRAALEAESTIGTPRFRRVRVDRHLMVALDSTSSLAGGQPVDWQADPLVEVAAALGEVADQLVARDEDGRDPVVTPQSVRDELRGIDWPDLPDGLAFSDQRLARLAAAASNDAAVSSRGELYRRGMDARVAATAARLTLLDRQGLTADQVQARVRARFPEGQPLPDRPALDQLLADDAIGVRWDADRQRYVLPDALGAPTSTMLASTSLNVTTYTNEDEGAVEAHDLDRRLAAIAEEGGFLAATVDPKVLDVAARQVAAAMGSPLIDLDHALVTAMRAAASSAGADWSVLVAADAEPPTDQRFRALSTLVRRAVPAVEQQLREAGTTAVVTGLGLFARYEAMDVFDRIRDQLTHSHGDRTGQLRGLVVVVPERDRDQRPTIDGQPVPVITASQWTRIPSAWLDRAHA